MSVNGKVLEALFQRTNNNHQQTSTISHLLSLLGVKMKIARKLVPALIVAIVGFIHTASAQVIKQVPANALVVLKVSNLEATSKKISDLVTSMGLGQMSPELADPLGWTLKEMGATEGVNKSGELAIVILDPDAVGGDPSKAVLGLFPITDYQAFLGNYQGNKTTGDVTEIHPPNSTDSSFVAHWGNYAVICDSKDYLSKKPDAFIEVDGAASKELENKDMVLLANVKMLRTKAPPAIEQARQQGAAALDQLNAGGAGAIPNMDPTKLVPVLKLGMNQILDASLSFLNQTNCVTYSTNISADGISMTLMSEFLADSTIGKLVAQMKNTDAPLLAGLPDGKYLFAAGSINDPALSGQFFDEVISPFAKGVTSLGADYAPLNAVLDMARKQMAATTGESTGMIAPTGALGQSALFQFIDVKRGDSKAMIDILHSAPDLQMATMKAIGMDTSTTKTTVTLNAKQLAGVSFYSATTTVDTSSAGPAAAQVQQMMQFMYGPNGIQVLAGSVDDKNLLTVSGLEDATITAAIAAIRNNDSALEKQATIKSVAAQLPPSRMSVMYIPLDVWISTGLSYAKQFGMDMGVKMPDDLPPLGITMSTEGSSIRVDSYMPSQLLTAITSAVMQMAGPHNGAPGGAAPAPTNGGL
jgi:hypothetical protein